MGWSESHSFGLPTGGESSHNHLLVGCLGMIVGMSEETDFPEIPIRTEITVIGPDDPNTKPVGFSVYEREGCEIFIVPEGLDPAGNIDSLTANDKILTDSDGLNEGGSYSLRLPRWMGSGRGLPFQWWFAYGPNRKQLVHAQVRG